MNTQSPQTDPSKQGDAQREHAEQNPQVADQTYGLPHNPSDETAKRNEATDIKHREQNEFIKNRNAPTDRQADKDVNKVKDKAAFNETPVNEINRENPNPSFKK